MASPGEVDVIGNRSDEVSLVLILSVELERDLVLLIEGKGRSRVSLALLNVCDTLNTHIVCNSYYRNIMDYIQKQMQVSF